MDATYLEWLFRIRSGYSWEAMCQFVALLMIARGDVKRIDETRRPDWHLTNIHHTGEELRYPVLS